MTTTHERELDLGAEVWTPAPTQTPEQLAAELDRIPIAFEPDECWEKAILKEAK